MKSQNKEKSPEKTEEQDNNRIKKVLEIIGKIISND